MSTAISATGIEHYCDQLHALRDLAPEIGAAFDSPPLSDIDESTTRT